MQKRHVRHPGCHRPLARPGQATPGGERGALCVPAVAEQTGVSSFGVEAGGITELKLHLLADPQALGPRPRPAIAGSTPRQVGATRKAVGSEGCLGRRLKTAATHAQKQGVPDLLPFSGVSDWRDPWQAVHRRVASCPALSLQNNVRSALLDFKDRAIGRAALVTTPGQSGQPRRSKQPTAPRTTRR